ncbi:DUF1186 domain-containing protein [Vibrio phage VAP7]|uniref:DUF1186 domain-containing protein n=1 Tax=Vibrio phage VAP7 TaxID=2584487 RepID=A0A4Y5TV81_9CAUD|nr:DUF1186 domain-containing protein [Vibrio phage VAP7]QDB73284.1 DUF1186 domain-containing protein [Vibrio phage VAP7]UFD98031.1 hypothetical protein [Vibrio phage BX-1]
MDMKPLGRMLRVPERRIPARRVKNQERNHKCACGSGLKFKKCCMHKVQRGF